MAKKKMGIVKKIFLGILGFLVLSVAVIGLLILKMNSDKNKYMPYKKTAASCETAVFFIISVML